MKTPPPLLPVQYLSYKGSLPTANFGFGCCKKQLLKHDDLLKWHTSQISKIITKTEILRKKVWKSYTVGFNI